jgi:hypothetical protein
MAQEDADRERARHYAYFVDGKPYRSDSSGLTGAQIKAKIPDFNPAYSLVQEGRDGGEDRVISDGETVNLDVHPPLQFYTVPPASFGRQ